MINRPPLILSLASILGLAAFLVILWNMVCT